MVRVCDFSYDEDCAQCNECGHRVCGVVFPVRRLCDSTNAPSLLTKAANFAKAAVKHVAAGAPMASEDEIARRHAICASCEFFTGTACAKCGCAVVREKQYLSKLSWADQSCPVGKWGPQTNLDS